MRHHAPGEPPPFEVIGYRDDEPAWTRWRSDTYRVQVHVQDLAENILDRAHFGVVHDNGPRIASSSTCASTARR